MIAPASLGRLARNAARLAIGAPLLGAQHLLRQRYVTRSSVETGALSEDPPPVEPATAGSTVQTRTDGTGPLVMRTYTVRIRHVDLAPEALISRLLDDPNSFSPQHIAGFHTAAGERATQMTLGGEYVVEIPGPWNGPVRVDDVTATSFTLVTLEGHMEAGHIRFRSDRDEDSKVTRLQIRSWARAGDRVFEQLHLGLKVGQEAQSAMWIHTCDRAVRVSGGTRHGPIEVETEVLLGSRDQRTT